MSIRSVSGRRVLAGLAAFLSLLLSSGRPADAPLIARPPVSPPPAPPLTPDFAVPVLMYHRIGDLPPGAGPLLRDLTVSPERFAAQIRYLVENRYTILTAGEVEIAVREQTSLPVRAVALTLDDGYGDDFTHAFPVLRRFGLDGTLFLVTSTVEAPDHITWDEARLMRDAGMEFGSHTVHHADLTTLSLTELDRELIDSKAELERQLITPIEQIAYPSGEYNERVKERARRAGYHAGWKKGGGWVTPDCDPLMLPRVRVRGDTTMEQFIRAVTHRPATRQELLAYGP